jgi:mannose-6-phosphate isomerase-like protein (cupin superfamily)
MPENDQMVFPLGNAEGSPKNRHRGGDQWLYVLSGNGIATVKYRSRHANHT